MVKWHDARAAELIGEALVPHRDVVGPYTINGRHVGVWGAGWTILVREVRSGGSPSVEVWVDGAHRWTVRVGETFVGQLRGVVAMMLPILAARRAQVSESTLCSGDQLEAVQGRWGIPEGTRFTVVRVISHHGHDPVTTYELDGPGVPRFVEVGEHDDLDVGEAWRRA